MKRILIIRPSAIGDIIMASPMIRALRRAWPDVYLAWLVDPAAQELLDHNPALDAVIRWSKENWKQLFRRGHWLKLVKEMIRLRRELRSHHFDLALDVQGLLRSRLLAWLCGAKTRWGFESKEPGRFLMTRIISRGSDHTMMSSEYRHMVHELGIDPATFAPDIRLSETITRSARKKRHDAGVQGPYIAICPFTTRPQKHWFNDRWAELGLRLQEHTRLPTVILGGPHDIEDSQNIISITNGPIYNFTGKTSIGESAAIIRDAALVVGVDTALTHLGTAFGRPTIALFGATCPYLSTESHSTQIVYHRLACSPCKRKPTCDGRYDCMQSIRVDTVFEAARNLLEQTDRHAHEHSSH